jgi:energy-coupling factor transporter ATP-binding protein EcfA2
MRLLTAYVEHFFGTSKAHIALDRSIDLAEVPPPEPPSAVAQSRSAPSSRGASPRPPRANVARSESPVQRMPVAADPIDFLGDFEDLFVNAGGAGNDHVTPRPFAPPPDATPTTAATPPTSRKSGTGSRGDLQPKKGTTTRAKSTAPSPDEPGPPGPQAVLLLGPNGSGKSSVMRAIQFFVEHFPYPSVTHPGTKLVRLNSCRSQEDMGHAGFIELCFELTSKEREFFLTWRRLGLLNLVVNAFRHVANTRLLDHLDSVSKDRDATLPRTVNAAIKDSLRGSSWESRKAHADIHTLKAAVRAVERGWHAADEDDEESADYPSDAAVDFEEEPGEALSHEADDPDSRSEATHERVKKSLALEERLVAFWEELQESLSQLHDTVSEASTARQPQPERGMDATAREGSGLTDARDGQRISQESNPFRFVVFRLSTMPNDTSVGQYSHPSFCSALPSRASQNDRRSGGSYQTYGLDGSPFSQLGGQELQCIQDVLRKHLVDVDHQPLVVSRLIGAGGFSPTLKLLSGPGLERVCKTIQCLHQPQKDLALHLKQCYHVLRVEVPRDVIYSQLNPATRKQFTLLDEWVFQNQHKANWIHYAQIPPTEQAKFEARAMRTFAKATTIPKHHYDGKADTEARRLCPFGESCSELISKHNWRTVRITDPLLIPLKGHDPFPALKRKIKVFLEELSEKSFPRHLCADWDGLENPVTTLKQMNQGYTLHCLLRLSICFLQQDRTTSPAIPDSAGSRVLFRLPGLISLQDAQQMLIDAHASYRSLPLARRERELLSRHLESVADWASESALPGGVGLIGTTPGGAVSRSSGQSSEASISSAPGADSTPMAEGAVGIGAARTQRGLNVFSNHVVDPLERVSRALRYVFGISVSIVYERSHSVVRFDSALGRVRVSQGSGGHQEAFMVLVATLVSDFPTVLIDEPGHNIHPGAQAALFDMLQDCVRASSGNKTVLAITHSERLVNKQSISSAYVSSMLKTGCIIQRLADLISSPTAAALSESDLEQLSLPPLSQLLFTRDVLLVEGPADYRVVSTLQTHLHAHTGKTALDVVFCNGSGVVDLAWSIACKLRLNARCLVDVDTIITPLSSGSQAKSKDEKLRPVTADKKSLLAWLKPLLPTGEECELALQQRVAQAVGDFGEFKAIFEHANGEDSKIFFRKVQELRAFLWAESKGRVFALPRDMEEEFLRHEEVVRFITDKAPRIKGLRGLLVALNEHETAAANVILCMKFLESLASRQLSPEKPKKKKQGTNPSGQPSDALKTLHDDITKLLKELEGTVCATCARAMSLFPPSEHSTLNVQVLLERLNKARIGSLFQRAHERLQDSQEDHSPKCALLARTETQFVALDLCDRAIRAGILPSDELQGAVPADSQRELGAVLAGIIGQVRTILKHPANESLSLEEYTAKLEGLKSFAARVENAAKGAAHSGHIDSSLLTEEDCTLVPALPLSTRSPLVAYLHDAPGWKSLSFQQVKAMCELLATCDRTTPQGNELPAGVASFIRGLHLRPSRS